MSPCEARHAKPWACQHSTSTTYVIPAARCSAAGATLKELMARLGHSSPWAALIHQHATRDRDKAIATALGTFVREARKPADDAASEPERDEEGA
jgi:hypothetical protein